MAKRDKPATLTLDFSAAERREVLQALNSTSLTSTGRRVLSAVLAAEQSSTRAPVELKQYEARMLSDILDSVPEKTSVIQSALHRLYHAPMKGRRYRPKTPAADKQWLLANSAATRQGHTARQLTGGTRPGAPPGRGSPKRP